MRKKIVATLLILIVSCQDTKSDSTVNTVEETVQSTPLHNTTSQLSISGMTCEIGCVRTVKSHLSKMNGVIDINMDFDTARAINYSTVKYDSKLVSENDMKIEIESIANGIYNVVEINTQKE